jgi:hypothetical protein
MFDEITDHVTTPTSKVDYRIIFQYLCCKMFSRVSNSVISAQIELLDNVAYDKSTIIRSRKIFS